MGAGEENLISLGVLSALACDTDGIDGTGDNAGCFVLPDTLHRARQHSLDAAGFRVREG